MSDESLRAKQAIVVYFNEEKWHTGRKLEQLLHYGFFFCQVSEKHGFINFSS
jgi:hypothetical protein